MRKIRLDLAAEYLLMAAMLAQIKSRLLLPRQVSEDEEEDVDPRSVLIAQLQQYEQFSKAAQNYRRATSFRARVVSYTNTL